MDKLFWGFFLLFLNFNLNFDVHTLNILPAWLGYILLMQGAKSLRHESELFKIPCPWCIAAAAYTFVLWVLDIIAFTPLGWINWLLEIIAVFAKLYITYLLIRAIADVEPRRSVDLRSKHLKNVWWVVAVTSIISVALEMAVLQFISNLVGFVAGICLLVAVHNTRKLYHQLIGM